MCHLAVSVEDPHVFASASLDSTAKLWDVRTGRCAMTFEGHLAEVNACCFLPGGTALATGSDDATLRVFDVRCRGELRCLADERVVRGAASLAATRSGRVLIGGYDDSVVRCWDLYAPDSGQGAAVSGSSAGAVAGDPERGAGGGSGEPPPPVGAHGGVGGGGGGKGLSALAWTLEGHTSRVSCVAVSRDGSAIASGSWDNDLRIWA